ncbi:MAG TPA: TIGR03619 family F420-dependent LLM class oxidoreductase [Candidatus Nanopelagicales bacterium]|nr:TIGR03619 family F420-dependent LLM class oxidoreductase [Candidatus Nanopelagicales bacterium]
MRVGLGLPVSGTWATPDALRHVATAAEERGFASLWTFQRLLHPVDEEWGAAYHAVHDPLTSLAYAAALTSRIRLGVAVVMAPYYAPIVLAKALTTIDVLSGGRLDVGLGLGWSAEEFEAVGVPMEGRGARAEEFVEVLRTIWTQDPVEHHGSLYDVPRSHVDPKPVQTPHPPLLMGGGAPAALRRVGRIADGWISSSRTDLTTVGEQVDVIKDAAREAGRDTDALRFIVRGVVRLTDEPTAGEARIPLQGSASQIRDDIARLAEQGITEVFLDLNWDDSTVGADDEGAALANADRVLEQLAP